MKLYLRTAACLAIAGLTAAAFPAHSQDEGVQVGVLNCATVPGSGLNLIITSSVDVRCEFNSASGYEYYVGETGIGLGIDLDVGRDEQIVYTVLSATTDIRPGSYMLEGKYAGAKASATAGVGAGAAVLVGGGDKNITLQPLALEASEGLGVAGGLTYLYLERDTSRPPRTK